MAGPAQGLVGLAAGVRDGLVSGLLCESQHPCRGVHVVFAAGQAHGGCRGRLRLPHRHFRLGGLLRSGGLLGLEVVHSRRGNLAAQALSEFAAQFLVLLDQTVELSLNLVEEGVDLFFVVSRS